MHDSDSGRFIIIDDYFSSLNITGFLDYFEDAGNRFTINTIRDENIHWERMQGKSVNLSFTDSASWLRFRIYNTLQTPQEIIFVTDTSTVDSMDLYTAGSDKKFIRYRGGDSIPFVERDTVNYRSFAYTITLMPGENTCFLKIKSISTIQFTPLLMTFRSFYNYSSSEMAVLMILLGWMILMMLYNLILFISSREVSYIYFVMYTLSWAVISLAIRGIGAQYLWRSHVWFQETGVIFAIAGAMIFGTLFTLSFIEAKKNYPLANKIVVLSVIAPAVLIMALGLTVSYGTVLQIALLHSIVFILLMFIISIYALIKNNSSAKYLIAGFAFYFIAIPVEILLDFGIIPLTFVSKWLLELSIAWLMLFSSLGLADKIIVMKTGLMLSEEKLQKQNEELEGANEELTATNEEMEAANEELISAHNDILESEEKFRSIYNGVNDAIFIHEIGTGRILDVNDKVRELFRYDKNEVKELTLQDLSMGSGAYTIEHAREKIELAAGGEPQIFEWMSKDSSGRMFPVEVALRRTLYGKNDVILAVVRDLSERKKSEEQLMQAQKMETVGTLAGGLAHDFNNVLGGILGPVSILRKKLDADDKVDEDLLRRYLLMMKQAGENAASMVKQLLTLSARQELKLAPVDLNLSIKHVMKICRGTFDKTIRLEPVYCETPSMIHADPAQVEQMLLNLCVNAAHAMTIMKEKDEQWGGTLTVSFQRIFSDRYFLRHHPDAREIDYWCLSVGDTGIGMDKNIRNKIFNPFFTTKMRGSGTGLGLAMVYNIVKQHRGFIDVSSEKGKGTTFHVYLPYFEVSDTLLADENDQKIYYGKGIILVVDDEERIRITARDLLSECGYTVLVAEGGHRALEIYRAEGIEIDAVLLDMSMPEMSGKETFEHLKKIDPNVNVVLTSGFKQDERVDEVMKRGIRYFIEKPYTIEKLSKVISAALHDNM